MNIYGHCFSLDMATALGQQPKGLWGCLRQFVLNQIIIVEVFLLNINGHE
jgi:hypothetical protein